MLRPGFHWPSVFACLLLFLPRAATAADGTAEGEAGAQRGLQVKAVFLFNFAEFVRWPAGAFPDANSPVVIGVLGDDPVQPFLEETVRNTAIGGHPLVARRFSRPEDIGACHVLYIAPSWAGDVAGLLRQLRGRNILTVGETPGFTGAGGMVRLIFGKPRTRIRIDLQTVKAAGLTVSSQLLRFAEIVGDKEG